MAEHPEPAEATPLLPTAPDAATDEGRPEPTPASVPETGPAGRPVAGGRSGKPARAAWHGPLAVGAAIVTASAVVALGPAEAPPPRQVPIVMQRASKEPGEWLAPRGEPPPRRDPTPHAAGQSPAGGRGAGVRAPDESSASAPGESHRPREGGGASPAAARRPGRGAPPARPAKAASAAAAPQHAAPLPAPKGTSPAVATALARYRAGDVEGARAALAAAASDPEATTAAARLEAIARLVGARAAWPPSAGAAALERLLELESALGLPHPSPLAVRALAELAERLVRKGDRLIGDGRLEEAAAAYRAALERVPDHPAALGGLERVERAAEALYLEGYLVEDDDLERAWRVYRRVLRLARPGGALAGRVAARLASLPAPVEPRGSR